MISVFDTRLSRFSTYTHFAGLSSNISLRYNKCRYFVALVKAQAERLDFSRWTSKMNWKAFFFFVSIWYQIPNQILCLFAKIDVFKIKHYDYFCFTVCMRIFPLLPKSQFLEWIFTAHPCPNLQWQLIKVYNLLFFIISKEMTRQN